MSAQEESYREPMPAFTASERFKESIYAIGDMRLFRPMSLLEVLVGMPLCALFCYLVIAPLTSGTMAMAVWVVLIYFSPKLLVWMEAAAGRPLVAELTASVALALRCARRRRLYKGFRQLNPAANRHERERLLAMIERERALHAQALAERPESYLRL